MARVLTPSGALALGYDREALARGIEAPPDIMVIGVRSTNSGLPARLTGIGESLRHFSQDHLDDTQDLL